MGNARCGLLVALLAWGVGTVACGRSGPGTEAPSTAATIYDEFLAARKLAAGLTAQQPGEDSVSRERRIFTDRSTLIELEGGIASKRTLLVAMQSNQPADSPRESLYFQVWSSYMGDGEHPVFKRLSGGGIEYQGRQFDRESALRCATPARLAGATHAGFFDCLATQQPGSSR